MAGFEFAYDEAWYTEQGAKSLSAKALRKEYTRMRDVAQKRIKRLAKEFPESKAYQGHREGFAKLKNLDPRDLPKAFAELAKFVRAKTSTVSGQRVTQAKTIATLNKAVGATVGGQAGVTKENYWRTIRILNEARKQKIVYGSDKIVTLAETTLELNPDQFDKVLDNLSVFLEHSTELEDNIEEYLAEKNLAEYQQVNMDDFLKEMGW